MSAWIAPAVCMLVCPLGMGVAMYFLGHDRDTAKLKREINRLEAKHAAAAGQPLPARQPTPLRKLWCTMCINWKVLAGLAAFGAALLIISPSLFASAGPRLLLLVCPLSMGLAMWGMARRKDSAKATPPAS